MKIKMIKEVLETIILNLVENKEQVTITEKQEEGEVTFEVKVAETDMGRVIGKQGRVAKAIRTVIKSLATKDRRRVNIEFVD